MISYDVFMFGLMVVSTLTGLVTEAVKKILIEKGVTYNANILSGIVSAILSAIVGVCYVLIMNIAFTWQIAGYIVALVALGWLCAMIGYDKVKQVITQFKTK